MICKLCLCGEKKLKKILSSITKIIGNNLFMLSYIYRLCPKHIFFSLLVSVLSSAASITNLLIIRHLVNLIQTGDAHNLFFVVLCMILLLFAINMINTFISSYIQQRLLPRNAQIICQAMQIELYDKASVVEMKSYDDPEFLNAFSMALQQSDARAQGVLNTFNQFFSNLLGASTLAVLIFSLDRFLILLVIVNVLLAFCISRATARARHSFTKERIQQQREMEYTKYTFYRPENAKEFRLCGDIKNMLIGKFIKASNFIIALIDKYGKKFVFYSQVQAFLNNVINSSILGVLAYKAINGLLLIGDFVTLTSSTQQLFMQLSGLMNIFPQMYEHSLYIDNFREFIDCAPPSNLNNGLKIDKINSIEVKNLFFTYPSSDGETLKNINIKIEAGKNIAIVGKNGGGKSTFIKLLAGLYETTRGGIVINGDISIKDCDLSAFRKCIGIVFQDYKLFALSIAENILMREIKNRKEDEKIVNNALEFVGLYEKVKSFPEGIYTNITREFSGKGAMFSGGEMQKIALARAYASDCSMLILDEPSSALDPLTEFELFNKMIALAKNKCSIFISHRLRNIKNVDHIYVFENGEIVENGNHDVLMQKKGLYYFMYNKQND